MCQEKEEVGAQKLYYDDAIRYSGQFPDTIVGGTPSVIVLIMSVVGLFATLLLNQEETVKCKVLGGKLPTCASRD